MTTQAHVPRGTTPERSPPFGGALEPGPRHVLLPTTTEALLGKSLGRATVTNACAQCQY